MRFIPVQNEFVAEVENIDVAAPLDAPGASAIHAGMDRYAVLVFHDQPLTDAQQIAFTASLGKIELNTANNVTRPEQGFSTRPPPARKGRRERSLGTPVQRRRPPPAGASATRCVSSENFGH
jgi:alpha-ketoglutarate-dependent taurine dioxygenase